MRQSVHFVMACSLASLVLGPCSATATDLPWTYVEGGYVLVDADESVNVENPKQSLVGEVTTDKDSGFYLGGSWRVAKRWHVFATFEDANQKADLDGTVPEGDVSSGGDFDLNRWRLGVGYALPMSERWDLYGRVSLDYSVANGVGFARQRVVDPENPEQIQAPPLPGDDANDTGVGAEIGVRIDLPSRLDGSAWLRYTSVGDLGFDRSYSAEFDSDVLGGVELHWRIGNKFGLEAGYEYGEISTLNLGARFIL
jgi:hypothetical protein